MCTTPEQSQHLIDRAMRIAAAERTVCCVAAFARQLGLEGIRVERAEDVGPAWDRALASRTPCVLDVVTDPEVPPLPPEIRAEHAKGMAKAIAKGDPERGQMIKQTAKAKLQDLTRRS